MFLDENRQKQNNSESLKPRKLNISFRTEMH